MTLETVGGHYVILALGNDLRTLLARQHLWRSEGMKPWKTAAPAYLQGRVISYDDAKKPSPIGILPLAATARAC